MKQTTLCFCIKDDQVLLAMKTRGFGTGKWNGYGGHIEEGEGPKAAAVRELKEESGLVADEKDLDQAAVVRFNFGGRPKIECFVYLVHAWQGEAVESEEMSLPRWYSIANLPFGEMWAADARWIPLVLSGKKIEARVDFNADGSAVDDFSYSSAEFNQ